MSLIFLFIALFTVLVFSNPIISIVILIVVQIGQWLRVNYLETKLKEKGNNTYGEGKY